MLDSRKLLDYLTSRPTFSLYVFIGGLGEGSKSSYVRVPYSIFAYQKREIPLGGLRTRDNTTVHLVQTFSSPNAHVYS